MKRSTKYYHGYGYITTGDGIFDNLLKFVTRKEVTDVIKEGAKAAGKSAASRLGEKAGEKIAEKIIKPKPKANRQTEKDLLKKIYGDGLKRGRGLKRI